MMLQSIGICFVLIGIFTYSNFKQNQVMESYHNISINEFPKVGSISRMIANFRLIRIKVRTLGVNGNKEEDQIKYSQETVDAIENFLAEKKKFDNMNFSAEESEFVNGLNKGWDEFLAFGKDLLLKYKNPTKESLEQGSHMIRIVCPVKAGKWMSVAEKFLQFQQSKTLSEVTKSIQRGGENLRLAIILLVMSTIIAILLSYFFSKEIYKQISQVAQKLMETVKNVTSSSETILYSSNDLSLGSSESSNSLVDTVASIGEISSRTLKNVESANKSTAISKESNRAAMEGKTKVDSMIRYVNDISDDNNEIAQEMRKNNEEISKIVHLISEIEEKTKVINEIVFQTKLLSFNASVEAARAGEHGKGFAVVAEEVGNLASMSGSAAAEITEMLEASTQKVTEIIENAKRKVDILVSKSQENVEKGKEGALACGTSLDEILRNVDSVNAMISEIAIASDEQSKDVDEITRSIAMLDNTTKNNTNIAKESSSVAKKLEGQAEDLNETVEELSLIVAGKKAA
ncbi:MAG: methyl-accepting chemotaxis protein [Bacteriovoracaceae bacterium]|jgi:methyl-accepting chemotaxis protein